jgi:hypothetical protein
VRVGCEDASRIPAISCELYDLLRCTSTLHPTGKLGENGVAGLEVLGGAVSLVCLTTDSHSGFRRGELPFVGPSYDCQAGMWLPEAFLDGAEE